MNKYFKGCLIALSIFVLIIGLVVGWFWWSMETNHKRAEEDGIKYSKECDTIITITEKPSITLEQFEKNEINQLRFYLVRNNKIIKDTTIKYKISDSENYLHTNIPFDSFKKSDSIIVETKTKIYFTISNFHHYANLHHGMFGYVGSHDCRFADDDYIINGELNIGILLKKDGISKKPLPFFK